LMVKKKAFI